MMSHLLGGVDAVHNLLDGGRSEVSASTLVVALLEHLGDGRPGGSDWVFDEGHLCTGPE